MFIERILNWLVFRLENNAAFQLVIKSICKSYFSKESLVHHRVWGNESRIRLGSNVQLNNALINTVSGDVFIGDDSFFGHDVSLLTGTHDYTKRGLERHTSYPTTGRDIAIGKGVWVASNVIIVGPCTIGDNAVIGAGSVVTGDLEANAIYNGVPAKLVRYL